MINILVKAAIIIFFVIPMVCASVMFVVAAIAMQKQDNLKQAEVKMHESHC